MSERYGKDYPHHVLQSDQLIQIADPVYLREAILATGMFQGPDHILFHIQRLNEGYFENLRLVPFRGRGRDRVHDIRNALANKEYDNPLLLNIAVRVSVQTLHRLRFASAGAVMQGHALIPEDYRRVGIEALDRI